MVRTNRARAALAALLGVALAGCGGSPGGSSLEGGADSDARRWSAPQPVDLPGTAKPYREDFHRAALGETPDALPAE